MVVEELKHTFFGFSLGLLLLEVVLTSPLAVTEAVDIVDDEALEAVDPLELEVLSAGLAGCNVGRE